MKKLIAAAMTTAAMLSIVSTASATDYGRGGTSHDLYAMTACDRFQRMSRAWGEGLLTPQQAQFEYGVALRVAAQSNSEKLREIVAEHYQRPADADRNASRFDDYCRRVPTWTHAR